MEEMDINKEKKTVSVIVPVYNAEHYIKRCIGSICAISRLDIEIILIDDGSTDKSLQICQEMQKQDNRIKVYTQVNSGVSFSRNRGINIAEGEWITFVDADDRIDSLVYELAINKLNSGIQCFCLGYTVINSEFKKIEKNDKITSLNVGCFNREEVELLSMLLLEMDKKECRKYRKLGIDFASPWGKFYSRKLLNDQHISFREDIVIGEDRIFNYQYFQYLDKIQYTEECAYYYYQNNYSVMNRYIEGKKDKLLDCILAFQDIASDHQYEVAQYAIRQYLATLNLEFCHPDNTKPYYQRKREALALRKEAIIRQSFQIGNIFKLRLAAIPIAIFAKLHMFAVCEFLLKVKFKLNIKI